MELKDSTQKEKRTHKQQFKTNNSSN